MNPSRHNQLKAAMRLLLQSSIETQSRSMSPDENTVGSQIAKPKMFTAPNRYRSVSPAAQVLSAPPSRRQKDSESKMVGSRQQSRHVGTAALEGAPQRRKQAVPPPPRRPYASNDDASTEESRMPLPLQNVVIHRSRSCNVRDSSCNHEQNGAYAKYLPRHCDKNGHCIRHIGLVLYRKHGSDGFTKVRDSCPLCMIDQDVLMKSYRGSEISKSSSARARTSSAPRKSLPSEVEEAWQNQDPFFILAQLDKHKIASRKERLEKNAVPHNGRFQSSRRHKPRPSSSTERYSSVERNVNTRHRYREESDITRSVSGHTVDRLSHILHKLEKVSPSPSGHSVNIATRSTCSSSYFSNDNSTDLISDYADFLSEYESKKSSASAASNSHHRRLKFDSKGRFISCTDYSCVSGKSRASSMSRDSFVSRKSRASSTSRDQNLPFDRNGCCRLHPSVILAVKKPFVKEWCIVQGACPLCVSDEAREFTYRRRPTISSIPSLF